MKNKLNTISLPLIQPEKGTTHNFYSICIKAIEDNKEGVLDKNECIKKIMRLKEEKFRESKKKYLDQTLLNFDPIRKKFRKNKVKKNLVNKRRTLSQILSESAKMEKMLKIPKLKKVISSKNINLEEQNPNIINDNENKEEKEINSKTVEYIRNKKIKLSSNKLDKNIIKNNKTISKRKEKTKKNIPKRYYTFKKIIEYLESNNIPLFELLEHNPFQKKPYQISKGYEFLEAVKFQNYEFVREALQTSTDYLFVFDYYGQTCYHWAAKLGNIRMLTLLLDYGKHHNQRDFKGRTPLYLAAVNNNRKVCDLLLKYKANVHLKDNFGNSVSDVAGSKELKYYLGDLMAQPYMNPFYKKKIADFLRKRDKNIEDARVKKRLKEIEEEHKIKYDEENENEEKEM